MPRRLVLFGEGDGEALSLPALVKKHFVEANAFPLMLLDENPFRVKQASFLLKSDPKANGRTNLHRYLEAARKRSGLNAIVLILDADSESCPKEMADKLILEAKKAGAGAIFSFAVCFAVKEYESWFISAASKMNSLPDQWNKPTQFPSDPESSPRDAKGWISDNLIPDYDPVGNQKSMTESVSLEELRAGGNRSFRHYDSAMQRIISACQKGNCVLVP